MGSYIELNNIEYNENDYKVILEVYNSFIEKMSLDEPNKKIVFDFAMRSIIVKSYNSNVNININRDDIYELKQICALVSKSLSDIREKINMNQVQSE